MKQATLWAGLLALYLPGAGAVEFNTDALKAMQEEGHKIVEEEQGVRTFQRPGGECLQVAGDARLVIRNCKEKADNQKFRFDDQGRLVGKGGLCVGVTGDAKKPGAGALLQECGGARDQQWRLDGKQRLVNGLKRCLQAPGDAGAQGDKVVSGKCGGSPLQVWQ